METRIKYFRGLRAIKSSLNSALKQGLIQPGKIEEITDKIRYHYYLPLQPISVTVNGDKVTSIQLLILGEPCGTLDIKSTDEDTLWLPTYIKSVAISLLKGP